MKQESGSGIRSQDASKLSVQLQRGAMEGVGARGGYNQDVLKKRAGLE